MAPSLTCQGPTGLLSSGFATASWAFTEDITMQPQAAVDVKVFDGGAVSLSGFDPATSTPVRESKTTDPDATSLAVLPALPVGNYVAYIKATDAGGVDTPWCATSFSIAFEIPVATRPNVTVAGVLGCGDHVVRIQDRGGGPVRAEVGFASLSYTRKLDDMSDARLTVGAEGLASDDCCMAMSKLRAWEHEISVLRDGHEVWVGPVGDPDYDAAGVTVPARDLFQWMERRNLEFDRSWTHVDLAEVFRQYVLDALSRDPTPGIIVDLYQSDTFGDRSIEAAQYRRAADELRELARNGVDFTMIGRRLLVGGRELPLPALPLLVDAMISDPHLTPHGLDQASEFVVVGATDPNATRPHHGHAGGVDPVIGLVQATANESSIKDDPSCLAAAQTRLDLLSGPSEFLTVQLAPEAPVAFADLVPGTRWPVDVHVACREVKGTLRLSQVAVDVGVTAQGVEEKVVVTLEPLGTLDAG